MSALGDEFSLAVAEAAQNAAAGFIVAAPG
jgi:hypothetical protein